MGPPIAGYVLERLDPDQDRLLLHPTHTHPRRISESASSWLRELGEGLREPSRKIESPQIVGFSSLNAFNRSHEVPGGLCWSGIAVDATLLCPK